MTDLTHRGQTLLEDLDGFSIEIDAERERADIILHRPPLNVHFLFEGEEESGGHVLDDLLKARPELTNADAGTLVGCRHRDAAATAVVRRTQMGRTVSACGPFAPWLASKETRWFSSSVRNPSDWMAE